MIAVDPRHAAMPVAHVFTEANVGHNHELRTIRLDRADCLLHHAVLGIRAAGRFVFHARNSEEQHGLQSGVVRALRLRDNVTGRQLENSRHAPDRLPRFQLFADKKRQHEIVRGEFRFAHEIAHAFASAQTSRPLDQFPHRPRLRNRSNRRKPGGLDGVAACGLNAVRMRVTAKLTTDYLLIDVSNSFVKLAFATREKIGKATRLATSKLTAAALRRILRGHKVKAIVVSSVVPKKNKAIRAAAGSSRVLFLNPKLDLGVGIDYPEPRSIGADRLANAAAVTQLYGTPAIVVDFGTAVTFDVVSAAGDYVGGVIAPGLEVMTNYLYQRTALLAKLTLSEPPRPIRH